MIIDIMFIVNHFQKFGDVFFLLYYFLHIRKGQDGSDEHACDAKAQTPFENETYLLISVATTFQKD